jgi:signal transduction histidine kinase
VCFGVVDGQLEVSVSDDGVGFDPDTCRGESSGMASMRSFAALSGGKLTVHSRPGHGTTVVARLGAGPTGGAAPPSSDPASDDGDTAFTTPRLRIVPNG